MFGNNGSRSFVSVMISLWRFGKRRWSVLRIIFGGGLRRVRCVSIMRSSFLRFVSSVSCRSVCRVGWVSGVVGCLC